MSYSYIGVDLETIFHQKKLHFFRFNPAEFYKSLEAVLVNDRLKINDTIRIDYGSSVELFQFLDEIQSIKHFLDEYKGSIHERILQNYNKIGSKRLIELFGAWIFWLALYPQSILDKPPLLLSLQETIQLAKSVLDDKYSEVFSYKPFRRLSPNSGGIYDIIKHQPNILARAICSQDCMNLSLLISNGLDLSQFEFANDYNDSRLDSSLQLAFACRNIEMCQFLIQNGCKPLKPAQVGLILHPKVKKDLKTTLFVLKTANLLNEKLEPLAIDYKSDSNHNLFHDSFLVNLYKSASQEEIHEVFELFLSTGFSLGELDQVCEHQFTQFTYCVCQTHIKPFIVKFLLQKFTLERGGIDSVEMQDELIDTIAYLVHYYENLTESVLRNSPLSYLTTNEILIVLKTLFPLVNRKFKVFNQSQFSIQHHLVYNMSVNGAVGLFDLLEFKLLDFLLNYRIFETVKEMDSLFASMVFSFNHEFMFVFTVYILENNFLNGQLAMSWFENVSEKTYFGPDFKNFIRDSVIPMCKFCIFKPRKLKFLARERVRSLLPSISDRNIRLLGCLPPSLELYLKQTFKVHPEHEAMRFFTQIASTKT